MWNCRLEIADSGGLIQTEFDADGNGGRGGLSINKFRGIFPLLYGLNRRFAEKHRAADGLDVAYGPIRRNIGGNSDVSLDAR